MITTKEAEELLKHEYHLDNFSYLISELLLPDYKSSKHNVEFNNQIFSKVSFLGESEECDISVFEVYLKENCQNKRVTITQEMFKILRNLRINNAVVSFVNADENNYRISLLTSKYEYDGDKVVKILSNPRRYSYSLGFGTKTKTAYKFLISKGKVNNFKELLDRFSVEVVNKQFYSEIAQCYSELVGGERDGKKYTRLLGLQSVADPKKFAEFTVRLIGRVVFCWFLKEKKSENGIPLIPENVLSLNAINDNDNYYHKILEPLFFELLNTNQRKRKDKFATEKYKQIPYLNGGLFSPHSDDMYKYDKLSQSGSYGLVNVPNSWIKHFYEVLSQYNFTVDENTSYDIELSIDPEMLGRIFENLLAEINPETGENAKKSTGSFYTPREIVDYMVDSSLLEYLKTKTNIDEIKLKALISYGKEDDEIAVFSNLEKKSIINSLYTITVLDPACGSGAFPIGMLQKIVYILQEVDPGANLWFDKATENVGILLKKEFEKKFNAGSLNYIRKLSVIQNSIFGIDIQPIAVEISRLRCFLSLIIEEKVDDDEENRGINPLPNLDFKFIIANSLIGLQENSQMSLFENNDHIKRLKDIRDEYFNADSERRTELKLEFKDVQQDMLLNTINNYQKQASLKYQQLSAWKPFENESTDWFDADWMFGIKEGFELVIGNPPYIQLQKAISNSSKLKYGDIYDKCGYQTFARTGDMYCLFYELGYNVLTSKGILTFITSNKWMRASYGENLRNFFVKKTNPNLLIDFFGTKVFDNATVDVNILQFTKDSNRKDTTSCIIKENCLNNLSNYIEQNFSSMDFSKIDNNWVILTPIECAIKQKIEETGTPIEKWNLNINRGILTGFNDAFIIDENTKNRLIEEDPKSAEVIRPILRGKDIKKYNYKYQNLYLISTLPSLKIDIEKYVAIKNHLLSFGKQRLEQSGITYEINGNTFKSRKYTHNKWFETQDCINYKDDFYKQKIIYSEIVQEPQFYLDTDHYFPEATTFIMTGDNLEIVLACLNSKPYSYAFKKYYSGGGLGEHGFRYKKAFLEKLPLPIITDVFIKNKLIELVKRVNGSNNNELIQDTQKEIDELLANYIGITEEEKRVINYN